MITTERDLLRKYDVPGPRYTSYPVIGLSLEEGKGQGSG